MDGLTVGMVVYDRAYEMPGRVTGFAGHLVCLARPTGLIWAARRTSVRPATDWERRQLSAIAKLHARRRLPAPSRRPGTARFAVCGTCEGGRLLRSLRSGRTVIIPCRSCRATGWLLVR
ncbi:hypothetical protein [Streptomyces sp. 35G-GA-8]|uniref:hypothetical protein n=1 Tax=Streptomyces sp. 35G-GA-8 TaxID=2939434 RepID=UPI00201EA523|nr:hypothetical protein [Streptomyces sp. 35G-GA-8]MCL7380743.1 hypothetical protein [Streptomyces sp. 35G-GA-8]